MKGKARTVLIIIILVLVVGLIAGGFFGYREFMAGSQAPELEEEVITPVIATKAVRGVIADFFQTNGEIVSASSVETYADVRGILARLYVELGDYVRANRVIAEVDPSQPGLTYALSPVRARVSGTITSLPLNQGDAVSTQRPIATIGDLSRLQVVAAIPERYISRIRIGLPSDIYLEAWPGYAIPVSVSEMNPVVDPASRAMKIKLDIPSDETRAKAGMYAKIRIAIEEKEDVVKLPTDAVLRRFGDTFVFVVEEDVAAKRFVVLGITQGGIVEIVEGVEAGERVVIQGQTLLEDGGKIRILEELQAVG